MKIPGLRFSSSGLNLRDRFVTSRFVRWTWVGLGSASYQGVLTDFRPTDGETVNEMVRGRYLLGSSLVDTQGASPFALRNVQPAWLDELQAFAWLRHFRDAPDEGSRGLARMLVLDWISRNGQFNHKSWQPQLLARRVMNWFRHYGMITEGAAPNDVETINKSINLQVQAARMRAGVMENPLDRVMARIVLVGAALSDTSQVQGVGDEVRALCDELESQLGPEGFYLSRNPHDQVQILTELVGMRQALSQQDPDAEPRLVSNIERMLLALRNLVLGTGELAYFNGSGQMSTDILLSLLMQGTERRASNALTAGYGIVTQSNSILVMDSGAVPDAPYARHAHASALAFEFSHRNQLVVGSCGPAPSGMSDHKDAFRQAVAHSAPSIDGQSAARIGRDGKLEALGGAPEIEVARSEPTITARNDGFQSRFGIILERQMSLFSEGETLVGRDRILSPRRKIGGQALTMSFHLGPGVTAEADRYKDLVRLTMRDGELWHFLWEGATVRVDESVRQSSHVGFHRTAQIILQTPLKMDGELAWLFTKQAAR